MLYLLGVNLPDKKLAHIALTSIYGIGRKTSERICHQLEIHPRCRLADVPESKLTKLSHLLNNMTIETELRRGVESQVRSLVSIGSYRGLRHSAGLPVRGQRTRGNAQTAKRLNGRFLKSSE